MKAGDFDSSGRRRTSPVEGSEFDIPCDLFIPAIGQVADTEPFAGNGLEIARNTFKADPRSLATSEDGVFAGGDCVSGPATVVEAIAAGKTAAASIDKYLGGDGLVVPALKHERKLTAPVNEEKMQRTHPKIASMGARLGSFAEVELGFDEKSAQREASRGLRCDVKG
jgi:NADH-quinone oxidoreductase subunit F